MGTLNEELKYECDKKWTMTLQRIKRLKPFYHCIFTNLPKVGYDDGAEVMAKFGELGIAVTPKEIVFNRSYVTNLPVEQMVFLVLHNITHYALMHIQRKCKVKYPEIYNIAADLYTNALLVREFNLMPGQTSKIDQVKINMPKDKIIYDPNIEIKDYCVEDIYEFLLKNGMKQNADSTMTVGMPRIDGQPSKIPDSENIIKQLMEKQDMKDAVKKLIQECQDILGKVKTDENGDITQALASNDLMDSDANSIDSYMKSKIIGAITECKMAGNSSGSLLEEFVNKIIAPKVDWRKLVRKFLVQMTSKESSYNKVDRRTLWHGAILPGQDTPDEMKLENVKMCTDTSGSISHEDLEIFYAQLAQLCKTYKVEGELIHWDSACQVMGDINEPKELYRIGNVYGRGGTDPSCLFEYFDSKDCKKKPSCIIILTDGYINFSTNKKEQWTRKYGKKTIWIINKGGNNHFQQPFGHLCNLAQN